jgi:epoxyqueuosine reductase
MGNWVFGCDLCQQVCPWNIRFASETPDEAFQPRPFLHKPSLIDFLNLSPEDFRREMQRSPLKRPKREGVLRNACIAAGNQGDSSLLNALHALLLNEEDPMLRAHAAWALGQIGGPASQEGLQKAREREENPEVIAEIVRALNL